VQEGLHQVKNEQVAALRQRLAAPAPGVPQT
jgi:hypothetical protein